MAVVVVGSVDPPVVAAAVVSVAAGVVVAAVVSVPAGVVVAAVVSVAAVVVALPSRRSRWSKMFRRKFSAYGTSGGGTRA